MHAFIVIASLLATSASALPALSDRSTPTGTTVRMCTGKAFTGDCAKIHVQFDQCYRAPYYKDVGSFKPAPGALCRLTTTAESCTTHGDLFVEDSAGISNLFHYKGPEGKFEDYGHSMTSFLCQTCSNCN